MARQSGEKRALQTSVFNVIFSYDIGTTRQIHVAHLGKVVGGGVVMDGGGMASSSSLDNGM
jgi:hypothetical protein